MFRRFKFEKDLYETLEFIPLAVRRKFDLCRIRLSLRQWQQLGQAERLAICHFPVNLEEEREALRAFVREAVKRSSGEEVEMLPESDKPASDLPAEPPARLVENAKAVGVELTKALWDKLDADERYALIKLGAGEKVSHNFAIAIKEFQEAYAS